MTCHGQLLPLRWECCWNIQGFISAVTVKSGFFSLFFFLPNLQIWANFFFFQFFILLHYFGWLVPFLL